MSYRMVLRTTGAVMLIEAAVMAIMTLVSLLYRENPLPFLITIGVLIILGIPLFRIKITQKSFFAKEGYVTAAITWIVLSLFGALPFYINGGFGNYINCLFEAVSGFTTTGATILSEIESLPKGILLWRSTTHFIGGMGILVLATAIIPTGSNRSQHLMRAEMPGPTAGKLVPRLSQSSKILYGIYIVMTAIEVICLLIADLPLFDAINLSLSTAGTGGFGVTNANIASYNSPAVEWIIAIFMMLFAINFTIYFLLLLRNFTSIKKNQELWFFIGIVVTCSFLIALNVNNVSSNFGEALRHGFFVVTSTISTSGFVTVDYDTLWPTFSKVIILFLTLTGACAGSTGGGIKISRILVFLKSIVQEIRQIIHPRSVSVIRVDDTPVNTGVTHSIMRFLAAWVFCFIGGVLLISLNNFDFTTTFTAVLTCIGNVGPGLSAVGPVMNFDVMSDFSKLVLSFIMLLGRLEIFPLLIFFSPKTWRNT